MRAKQPPTPPKGTVAGRPTTDRVEPKLALENAAERTLEPVALQLTNFFADLMVQSVGDLVYLLQAEIFSWRCQYWIERLGRRRAGNTFAEDIV